MNTKNMKAQSNQTHREPEASRSGPPLCREPWESYYILRRGILPCCHGSQPIAPMSEWEKAWNSPQLQEIRAYLSQGKLSPYCLDSLSCPIVQRVLAEQKKKSRLASLSPQQRAPFLRLLNRALFRIPGRIYRAFQHKKGKKLSDIP